MVPYWGMMMNLKVRKVVIIACLKAVIGYAYGGWGKLQKNLRHYTWPISLLNTLQSANLKVAALQPSVTATEDVLGVK